MKKYLIFLFLAFTFSGTIFGQMPQIEAGVSQELAKWRAANYSDAEFRLDILIETKLSNSDVETPKIEGKAEISLFSKSDRIVLDWDKIKGKEKSFWLQYLNVNGKLADFKESNGHIIITDGVLKNGRNTIKFAFSSPIADDASVKLFADKESYNDEYIYSQFSTGKLNTAFPVFGQPDLKARFKLLLMTKLFDWTIVSNTQSRTFVTHGGFEGGYKFLNYDFEETEPISIKTLAFAAGRFEKFEDEADTFPVKTAPKGSTIFYEPLKNPNAAKVYVRRSQEQKFREIEADFFRLNRKNKKSAKLDIILLPEIFNIQNEFSGIKFISESSVLMHK